MSLPTKLLQLTNKTLLLGKSTTFSHLSTAYTNYKIHTYYNHRPLNHSAASVVKLGHFSPSHSNLTALHTPHHPVKPARYFGVSAFPKASAAAGSCRTQQIKHFYNKTTPVWTLTPIKSNIVWNNGWARAAVWFTAGGCWGLLKANAWSWMVLVFVIYYWFYRGDNTRCWKHFLDVTERVWSWSRKQKVTVVRTNNVENRNVSRWMSWS